MRAALRAVLVVFSLEGAADCLAEAGVDTNRIGTSTIVSESPVEDIVDATQNHDILTIGESEPSLVVRDTEGS